MAVQTLNANFLHCSGCMFNRACDKGGGMHTKSILSSVLLSLAVIGLSVGGYYLIQPEPVISNDLPQFDLFDWADNQSMILFVYAEITPGTSEYPNIGGGLYQFSLTFNQSGNDDWTLEGELNSATNDSSTATISPIQESVMLANVNHGLKDLIMSMEGNGSYYENHDYQPGEDPKLIPDPYQDLVDDLAKEGISMKFMIFNDDGSFIDLQFYPRGIVAGIAAGLVFAEGENHLIGNETVHYLYSKNGIGFGGNIDRYYYVPTTAFPLANPLIGALNQTINATLGEN